MKTIRARPAILVALAIGFLFSFSSPTQACDCFSAGPVCQEYWQTSAVFVGTVIDSKIVRQKREDFEDEQRLVRLSVDEGFRGVEGPQVEVRTGTGGGDCGYNFRLAQQYLVYASEHEGKLFTGICSRTREIAAAADDLKYMRGLANGKLSGSIFGQVESAQRNAYGGSEGQPVAAATITINGVTTKEIKTDAKGEYRISGLAPGDYIVRVDPPRGLTARELEEKVKVSPGGCAVVSFWLENDGQLNGRVLNPQGLPVNKAQITLMEFDKEWYKGYVDYSYSDEEGRYRFKRIPPGKYVLSIRFDGMTNQNRPFPVIYYPFGDRTQAKIFSIERGQTIADFNLEMPPLPLEFEVSGDVVWSDGKPAVGAVANYIVEKEAVSYLANKNGESHFSFKAYEGLKLSLSASIKTADGTTVYSDHVQVTVAPGAPLVRLVLPKP
ncbi:MAG TPA: carboxypeptidase regulatory-like domain-containing protein [Pyrinomonadaceae bacterium]|nr:carboxypeptidase regulatory-like domain-containing protein [Pyrinomonadaceae bacterium]